METISNIFLHTVPFILVLSILVFVHELGHFLVARFAGVKVEVFSIGFGKEIFGFNDKSGTRWKFSMIPLGGYVRMFGDANEASAGASKDAENFTEEEKKVSFPHQSALKKLAIIFAGPFSNYLFAVLALTFLIATYGRPKLPAVVGSVVENSAAFEAGIEAGDKILAIDDVKVDSFTKLQRIIRSSENQELLFQIERNQELLELIIKPKTITEVDEKTGKITKKTLIGIVSAEVTEHDNEVLPFYKAFPVAVADVYDINAHTLTSLWQMITRKISADDIGGPIRIAEISADVARSENPIPDMIFFIAVLSVNLGLVNLLPIPMLDGGHIVFYLLEALRGKSINEKAQDVLFKIGLFLLLTLMVFATWNDIVRLFHR